ncbi:MAG: MBL fold metallo-hydrolase [Fusobacteriaceae bacterium]
MKISILGSGSSGNCTFIESDNIKILIDAGFSCKKIEEKLLSIGEKLEDISGVLITHEHGDHIMGAGIISRKYCIPIYISSESYEHGIIKLGKIEDKNVKLIEAEFFINSLKIIPFDVMHDAVRTLGFRIEGKNGKTLALATDIGYVDNRVKEKFKDIDLMVIECNYDYHMLMDCSYPWDLKARVKGKNGHLSNDDSAKFIGEIFSERLKKVYLVHVSKDSNNYSMALKTVEKELERLEIDVVLEVAGQDITTKVYEI